MVACWLGRPTAIAATPITRCGANLPSNLLQSIELFDSDEDDMKVLPPDIAALLMIEESTPKAEEKKLLKMGRLGFWNVSVVRSLLRLD